MTVVIILSAFSCGGVKVDFEATFYFVCYSIEDNAVSAGTLSGTVSDYGGAGYVLEYRGSYYVTIACYYDERDANTVRMSLLRRGLNCNVLEAERDDFTIKSNGARGRIPLYLGNLDTLFSLSKICYDCANGLDTGEYGQSAAREVLESILSGLKGLKSGNAQNCFSYDIERLIAECTAAGEGYVYSKEMRNLQIAIADVILSIELY